MSNLNTIADRPAMDFAVRGPQGPVVAENPATAVEKNREDIRHPAKRSFASDVDTKKVGTVRSTSSANEDKGDFRKKSIEKLFLKPQETNYQAPEWKKNLDKIASWSSWVAFMSNLFGAPLVLMNFSDRTKKLIETTVNNILNLSFLFYGASGVANGKEKNNIFMMLGFLGEMIFPWFGKLKYTYLLRGLPTGLDQLWVATDPRLQHKYKNGIFPDITTGFKEVIKVLGKLTTEFIQNPLKTLLTRETKGHHAFLSSAGSGLASIGYMLTGKENIFGPLRDLSGPLFDWAMLATKNKLQNISGVFFMFESAFDFVARVFQGHYSRIACNMLSHACGRFALELYKNSDSVATVKV